MYCTEVSFKIVCLAMRIHARLKVVPARAARPGRPALPALLIETFGTPAAAARRRRRTSVHRVLGFLGFYPSDGRPVD